MPSGRTFYVPGYVTVQGGGDDGGGGSDGDDGPIALSVTMVLQSGRRHNI